MDSGLTESKISHDHQAPVESFQLLTQLQLALKLHQNGSLTEAETVYENILKTDPENADALHLLGMIAHNFGKSNLAVNLIQRALSIDAGQPMFYNNLGIVYQTDGKLGLAADCFQKAIQIHPEYAEAHYGLGKTLHLQGRLDEAIKAYNKVLIINPEMTETIINLGQAFQSLGAFDKAFECYQRVSRKNPDNSAANLLIASVYIDQDEVDQAKSLLENVLAKDPSNVDALFKYALVEEKLNQLDNAVASYRKIINLNPNFPEVFINLGRIHKGKYELNKALECYQSALILNPDIPEAHNNVGIIRLQLGQYNEAISCFRKALKINQSYVLALHNLGNTFQKMGLLEEAIDCYRKTLSIEPDFIAAYYHIGLVYQTQKKHEQAVVCFRKALLLNPNYTKATCYLYHQSQYLCDWKGLDDLGARIESATLDCLKKAVRPDEPPFLSLSRRINPLLDLKVADAWSAEVKHQVEDFPEFFSSGTTLRDNCDGSSKKIIVGYISNNFKNHPTGHLLSSLFRHHNRNDFDIFCYSFGEDDQSNFRKQIKKDCDKFVEIGKLSHFEAAKRIYHDRVNILVDLVGFTHGHRLNISAMRPAPVQVRWLGLAGTTGADFFDYIIMDPIVSPINHQRYYSEKLVRMPHCYQINNRDQVIAKINLSKEDLGLPEKDFVFCCFCSRYKLDPIMFDSWMRILKKVPQSVLWLFGGHKQAEKNLKNYAQNKGLRPDKLVFARPLPKDEHLARLRLADLALDTRIVNGAATTSDALWAGVPVLTLQGSHFASRMSSSIINAIGLPELITFNLETYESLAVRLARNPRKLNTMRLKLAQNRLTKPLFDTPLFTLNLEKAYREMWKICLSAKKPRQINVAENEK